MRNLQPGDQYKSEMRYYTWIVQTIDFYASAAMMPGGLGRWSSRGHGELRNNEHRILVIAYRDEDRPWTDVEIARGGLGLVYGWNDARLVHRPPVQTGSNSHTNLL